MANDVPPPTLRPDPILRFRMRTLLAVTTAVAVLAAIAGPYYRRQSEAAQSQLLVLWGSLAAATALWAPFHWRSMRQMPNDAGEVRHVVRAARRGRAMWRKWPGAILAAGAWFGLMATYSEHVAARADRGHVLWWSHAATAFNGGMCTAILLTIAVPRPTVLAEQGVWLGPAYAPWKYIRHAEWLADRPGVMEFRRLDGDIYIDVPERVRDEVEAFVRTKTTLMEPARVSRDAAAERGGDV